MRSMLSVSVIASLCGAIQAEDTVLVHEPIDGDTSGLWVHSNGYSLHNFSSGSGWAQAWEVQSANETNHDGFDVRTGGLSYGDLAVSGNQHITGGSAYKTAYRKIDVENLASEHQRALEGWRNYALGVDGKTYYASVLVRADQANIHSSFFTLARNRSIGSNNNDLTLRADKDSDTWQVKYLDTDNSNYATADTGVAVVPGETLLLVYKINLVIGNDSVDVFINPDMSSESANTPVVSLNTGDLYFQYVGFQPHSGANGGSLDEFRFATSWAAALPTSSGPGPLLLDAVAVSHESVQLSWNEEANALSYQLLRSSNAVFGDGDDVTLYHENADQGTSYTDTSLSAGTTYHYQVNGLDTVAP